jgi:hypothetical protein
MPKSHQTYMERLQVFQEDLDRWVESLLRAAEQGTPTPVAGRGQNGRAPIGAPKRRSR